jgi:hypothetical protein
MQRQNTASSRKKNLISKKKNWGKHQYTWEADNELAG